MPDLHEFCTMASNAGKLVLVAALDGTFAKQVRVLVCRYEEARRRVFEVDTALPAFRSRLGQYATSFPKQSALISFVLSAPFVGRMPPSLVASARVKLSNWWAVPKHTFQHAAHASSFLNHILMKSWEQKLAALLRKQSATNRAPVQAIAHRSPARQPSTQLSSLRLSATASFVKSDGS